ncbi:hypothetical protein EV421DRAFT_1732616 [Armillaria borealis]|uniref:Uncharacterized protein n=1 Tax=Armillaria borealis TaxID=47425 RepID=A0AA39MX63_9AGAR|nr:hypothetical protein EV421DRAFT_1732616 [Armillaria borealis]
MTEHQEDVLTAPTDDSVGGATASKGNNKSLVVATAPHSPATSPPVSSSPLPLSQKEAASESDDSDTKVITDANVAPSNMSLITPQEAAAILSVLTPQEDSQWIPGVEFTELPPQDLTTSNLLRSKRFSANRGTLNVSGGTQLKYHNQEDAVVAFNRALHTTNGLLIEQP